MSGRVSSFSRGGSTTTIVGEITRELVNASDGQGLHFDGAAGLIDIASPPDLGTKFSFEFIVQVDEWPGGTYAYLADFSNGGRFLFGTSTGDVADNLAIHSVSAWSSFGVKVLDDLKVHHLVMTVDGTAATLYDNGNQVGTATITSPNIDSCSDAVIGSSGGGQYVNGTMYRVRFWNKALTAAEVTDTYENATVNFADQWGSQTEKITNAVDRNFTGGSSNWVNSGCDSFDDTNDLSITTSSTADFAYLPNAFWTKAAGKRFRLQFDASAMSGDSYKVAIGASNQIIVAAVVSGSNVADFIYDGSGNGNLFIAPLTSNSSGITLDNFSIVEIGVVADYDLAFANPTQSLTVQDRAGAADGTASASGVTQVTPIEQLNTKSLRIGTTAATPADGEIKCGKITSVGDSTFAGGGELFLGRQGANEASVMGNAGSKLLLGSDGNSGKLTIDTDGNVGIGVTPETDWDSAHSALQIGLTGSIVSGTDTSGWTQVMKNARYVGGGAYKYITTDEASSYQQKNDGSHVFAVAASGTADAAITWTDAMTIDSSGHVSINDDTAAARFHVRDSANDNLLIGTRGGNMNLHSVTDAGASSPLDLEATAFEFKTGLATFSNGISVTTGGVKFPATQSASADANVLDDYEEGTFTPSLGGNTTYHAQTGEYTRVGRLVSIRLTVFVNAIGTGSTYEISGLPFAVGGSGVGPSISVGYATLMAVSPVFVSGYLLTGSSAIKMAGISSASASMTAGLGVFGDGTTMNVAASYYV